MFEIHTYMYHLQFHILFSPIYVNIEYLIIIIIIICVYVCLVFVMSLLCLNNSDKKTDKLRNYNGNLL